MKKRWLGILLTICMVLTLLPTAAWAEGETGTVNDEIETPAAATEVSTAKELTAAVSASGSGNTVRLKNNIQVSGYLDIDRSVTLDLNDYTLSATGIRIGYWARSDAVFTATGGTIDVPVNNTAAGIIRGGTFSGPVNNNNVISGGTFHGKVGNCNFVVFGASAKPTEARITGGDFYGEVTNGSVNAGNFSGTIIGGSFYGKVTNTYYSMITGGSFYGEVESNAQKYLWNGIPYGCITGGTFYDGLTDNSTGEGSVQTYTVTYYDNFNAEPYAKQVVPSGQTATAPADPKVNGFTFLGWYTDEDCTSGNEYGFETTVTGNITLYGKWDGTYYGIRITDKDGEVFYITGKNANNVLGDGTVSYVPGYIEEGKDVDDFTAEDLNKMLRGETVEGIRLPKLTLNGASFKQLAVGNWGDDSMTRQLNLFLQLELMGDNTIAYDETYLGEGAVESFNVWALCITGNGKLSVTAPAENGAGLSGEWGLYRQESGTVTITAGKQGIWYDTDSSFNLTFHGGRLMIEAGTDPKVSYSGVFNSWRHLSEYCNISENATFLAGDSAENYISLTAPYTTDSIRKELDDAQEAETLTHDPYYLSLTANYTVTFDTDDGSAVTKQTVAYGKTAQEPTTTPTRSGYTFAGWYLGDTKYDFDTTVTKNITLTAHWTRNSSGGGGGTTTYTLTFDTNGGSALSALRLARGSTVDLARYVPERSGHVFTGWYADAALTQPIERVTLSASTTVYAGWRAETGDLPFTDVDADAWYRDDVQYVYDAGLMTGTTADRFAPNGSMTRAMLVTVLWRQAGSPVVNYAMDFSDVAEGAWYAEAVRWAAAEGVVGGYGDGRFGPDDPITREQLATILFRHLVGDGAAELADWLRPYADADQIGAYAVPAMQWAVGHGVLKGDGDRLDPQGTATRAQVAAVLHRALEL